ncbi:MAG: hypothetical protein KIT58_04130 [Planctomycetota bacterium]|nr:hypothetical protein [Planctomycetota bacterium]
MLHRLRLPSAGLSLVLALLAPGLAQAQAFDSGSNGSDGALTFAANLGTVVFDPRSFDPPLDPDDDGVYHFTTITIGVNTTVRLDTRRLPEGRPVVWLASGAVLIEGVVDLNGENGHNGGGVMIPAVAGAGGWSGGVAWRPSGPATNGNGPGGGGVTFDFHGGSAGHLNPGGAGASVAPGGVAYGNDFLLPLLGGSGGGGGGRLNSAGGGAGGGALLIASSVSVRVTGVVRAIGGSSGNTSFGNVLGGAGSGGAIRLIAPLLEGSGQLQVTGGGGGGVGSPGRVRLEAYRHVATFNVTPGAALMPLASPGTVLLPPSAPLVRVVRVAGQDVAASPTGSFVTPDVTIDAAGTVTVELQARNVPPGTVLQLTFQPETGSAFTASSSPLTGTLELSTATVQAQFPHGGTRVFVRASWTP